MQFFSFWLIFFIHIFLEYIFFKINFDEKVQDFDS